MTIRLIKLTCKDLSNFFLNQAVNMPHCPGIIFTITYNNNRPKISFGHFHRHCNVYISANLQF